MTRIECAKCKIKIPKHHPKLYCDLCKSLCHFKCNNLSKAEALLIANDTTNTWTCQPCTRNALPINACSQTNNDIQLTASIKCNACNKRSKCSLARFATCPWCEQLCHKQCISGELGCSQCCKNIIPGYFSSCREITNTPIKNDLIFNPYSQKSHINQIGDENRGLEENYMCASLSENLNNCQYTQLKNIRPSKGNELKILSMNVRALYKNIHHFNDNAKNLETST